MNQMTRAFYHRRRGLSGAGLGLGAIVVLLLSAAAGVGRALPVHAGEAAGTCPIGLATPRPGIDYDARYTVITFTNQCGQAVPLAVDIAANEARRETGLMNVDPLPADQGELFIFTDIAQGAPVRIGFYMKDTPVPLSVAFVGEDGTVQEIQDMQPETLDIHLPAEPYLYAIEANQGWFASNGIVTGSRADLARAVALSH